MNVDCDQSWPRSCYEYDHAKADENQDDLQALSFDEQW